jgi:hypothetical protein
MTITKAQCEINQAKVLKEVRKEKHEIYEKMQGYVESISEKLTSSVDKLTEKVSEHGEQLAINNTNTSNVIEEGRNMRKKQEQSITRISNLEGEKKGLYKLALAVTVFVPIIWSLLVYIYIGERMTEEKVEEIVKQNAITKEKIEEIVLETIHLNYEVQWQND